MGIKELISWEAITYSCGSGKGTEESSSWDLEQQKGEAGERTSGIGAEVLCCPAGFVIRTLAAGQGKLPQSLYDSPPDSERCDF